MYLGHKNTIHKILRNYYKTIIDEFIWVKGTGTVWFMCNLSEKIPHNYSFFHFTLHFTIFTDVVFFIYWINLHNSLGFFLNIETVIIFRNILSYRMWFSAKVKRLKDYELFLTAWQTSETTEMVHLFSVKLRAVYGVCLDIWKQRDNIWFLVVFIQAVINVRIRTMQSWNICCLRYIVIQQGLLPLEKNMSWS